VAEATSTADVQTFRFPRGNGFVALFCIVFLIAFLALVLVIPFLPARPAAQPWIMTIVGIPFFSVFFTMSCQVWRSRRDEIRVDGSRITWCRRERTVTMSWSHVEAIREYTFRRRFELVDESNQRLPLDYELTDFASLLEIVSRNTPRLRERHLLMHAFRCHPGERWLYIIAMLFSAALAAAGVVQGELSGVLVGLGMCLLAVVAYGRTVHTIEVRSSGLILLARFRTQHLAWRDIADVGLVHDISRSRLVRGPAPTVRIEPRAGKPIGLGEIVEGTIALFDAVSDAWRRAGAQLA
jgi:hypothetical protein